MARSDVHTRKRIQVRGVVQGIGFRPYIYLQATRRDLKGLVFNTVQGVTIEVEGEEAAVNEFVDDLETRPPPLARISGFDVAAIPLQGETSFVIKESLGGCDPAVVIPPDLALCPECLKELNDPSDRRYRYPFINCTQCGPRLTIVRKVPYDRENTSMASFRMCPECEAEFHDPSTRRFHAQPNACSRCGPRVWLVDNAGSLIQADDPVRRTAKLLKEGAIVAIKGLGGFHLAVDATNEEAVQRLRSRKSREGKPLAVMSGSIDTIRLYAEVAAQDAALLDGPLHPILLFPKREPNPLAPSVAPCQRSFGVMLPYTPVHAMLLAEGFIALVMTSGNRSEEPIAIQNAEAMESLQDIADCFLLHDREILVRCDDSVVMPVNGTHYVIRRARGYVPLPVRLRGSLEPVLALGAEMKNTLCVLREDQAFLSQHIGDLDSPGARRFFDECLSRTQEIAGVFPRIIAHDRHPDYHTTRLASGMSGMKDTCCYAVQHHHAHLVSCMADNELKGPVAGLIFDGTGYGTDGTIWGGEVLVGDEVRFERAAHIAPFPLPGGDAATLNPWRIALGLLLRIHEGSEDALSHVINTILDREGISPSAYSSIHTMLDRGINTPITSSMGRLFDAVSVLLGFTGRVSYEGQAAIELEYHASRSDDPGTYPVVVSTEASPWRMEIAPIILGIVEDLDRMVPREVIGRRFHTTIIRMGVDAARAVCERHAIDRVVVSGGCFQNRILLEGIVEGLRRQGIHAFFHRHVPTNDGGISLGQAVCAAALNARANPR
ncbi:MAG: carbamoyltransferase HypF [bacterium]